MVGNLTVDGLAIAALVGLGILLVVIASITIWFVRQAAKKPGEK